MQTTMEPMLSTTSKAAEVAERLRRLPTEPMPWTTHTKAVELAERLRRLPMKPDGTPIRARTATQARANDRTGCSAEDSSYRPGQCD